MYVAARFNSMPDRPALWFLFMLLIGISALVGAPAHAGLQEGILHATETREERCQKNSFNGGRHSIFALDEVDFLSRTSGNNCRLKGVVVGIKHIIFGVQLTNTEVSHA